MITKLNDIIDTLLQIILAFLFSNLILVVFLQITARNIFQVPVTWTLDLAQLIFSWCIFLGAALALRHGGHYLVDLWAKNSRFDFIPKFATYVASLAVIYVLIWHGALMSMIGLNRESLALNISEFWFYLPIPICGGLMVLFLIEKFIKGEVL